MHNWRLQILAFLAVFHPIASFTERSLVDGREECCESRNTLLRDTRLSYGTNRPDKAAPEERRVGHRVVSRENRRYEVRNDDSGLIRSPADRRLVDFRSERRVDRISPDFTSRFSRVDYRRVSIVNNQQRERDSIDENRNRRTRETRRTISRDERSRDIAPLRFSREADIRQHDRDNRESTFRRMSADNRRIVTNTIERTLRISMDTRRETRRNRDNSGELRSVQETRETRNVLQRARDDVARSELSRERQQRQVIRERMDERRAFQSRSESRLQLNNRRERLSLDRRGRESINGHRRSSSLGYRSDRARVARADSRADLREDIRDERIRLISRRVVDTRSDERHQQREEGGASRDRVMAIRRESREQTSENRRSIRESEDRTRTDDMRNIRRERGEIRRESNDERQNRAYVREDRTLSETSRLESRRNLDRESIRDNFVDSRYRRSVDRDSFRVRSQARAVGNTRPQREERNNEERTTADSRYRFNSEFSRTREDFSSMFREKTQAEDQTASMNWQYLFYTLQGIYLCSVLMQMMSENGTKKKSMSQRWWSAQSSVKVD